MITLKHMGKVSILLAIGFTGLTAQANVPQPYGAIAYSSIDGVYGVSAQNPTIEGAEQEAESNCAVIAGGRNCRVVISYGNACAALAVSADGAWGADSARTTRGELMRGMNEAFAKARAQCETRGGTGCRLEQATCSFDPAP